MIDLFSRYVNAVALPNQNAQTVSMAHLNSWILRFGAPRKLLTDQGTNFESAIFSNFSLFGESIKLEHPPITRLRTAHVSELTKLLNMAS